MLAEFLGDFLWQVDAHGHCCQHWALAWQYRKQNLLKELLTYKADILCLQASIPSLPWHAILNLHAVCVSLICQQPQAHAQPVPIASFACQLRIAVGQSMPKTVVCMHHAAA